MMTDSGSRAEGSRPSVTQIPAPAAFWRVFALDWLMSRAFTPNRAVAVMASPVAVISLMPYTLRHVVYESPDRDGMVILARHRPWLDVLLALPFAVVAGAGMLVFLVVALLVPWSFLLIMGVFAALVWGSVAMMSGASFSRAVGAETPAGTRWGMMSLAQRPGTTMSALVLTRQLLRTLPAGAVVVAVDGSDALADGYARMGFVRGSGPRVHWAATTAAN